jgi:hypothetical protein
MIALVLLLLSSINVSIAVPVSPIIAFLKLISLSKDSNVFELLGSESAIFSPLLPVNTTRYSGGKGICLHLRE